MKKYFTSIMKYTYLMILVAMLALVLVNVTHVNKREAHLGLGSYVDVSDLWRDQHGRAIDFSEYERYQDAYGDIWAYVQLDEKTSRTSTLVFRSKNAYVTVYADEKQIYETDIITAPFSNASPGTRWNIIELEPEQQGMLSMKIVVAYDDGKCKVDYFYFGDGAAIVLNLIEEKLISIFISIVMLILGCAYIVSDIVVSHKKAGKRGGLGYLGAFTVLCSIWALLETNVLQLFGDHLQVIQLVSNTTLVVAIVPLFLYLDSTFQIFKNRIIRYVCAMDMLYIICAIAMQITGGLDFHQSLTGAAFGYGLAIFALAFLVFFAERKEAHTKHSLEITCEKAGIIIICVCTVIDFTRYLMSDVMDRAFFIRIGLLLGVALLGVGDIYRITQLVRQGHRAELVSKLAYEDGLTELANRTAYQEKIKALIETDTQRKMAIIYFDINNLKAINDSFGHKAGDLLIQKSAEGLKQVFGTLASLYRIGGDEFVGLLLSEQPEVEYNTLRAEFERNMSAFNQTSELGFELSIAMGVAYCETISKETIEQAEKEADKRMYENKLKMKEKIPRK